MAGVEQLPLAGYVTVRRLGAGAFGEVFSARDRKTGEMVVVKRLPKAKVNRDMVQKEVAILRHLENTCRPFILCFRGFTEDANNYYVFTEFLDGFRPLEDMVPTRGPNGRPAAVAVTDAQKAAIARKAVEGLAVIHSRGVAHRDLKPANLMARLLPGGEVEVKIIDFGLSCMAGGCSTQLVAGSPVYEAPELYLGGLQANKPMWDLRSLQKTDMWSLGITLWELVRGQLPWAAWVSASTNFLRARNPRKLAMWSSGSPADRSKTWNKAFMQNYNYNSPNDQIATQDTAVEQFMTRNNGPSLRPLLQRNPTARALPPIRS